MTLVEILVAMLILTILMGALAVAILSSYTSTANSLTRLNTSHDRQLVTVYLPRDLLSANAYNVRTPSQLELGTNVLTPDCPNAPKGAGPANTTILELTWQGLPPPPTTSTTTTTSPVAEYFAVDYGLITVNAAGTGASYQLVRYYCHSSTAAGGYSEAVPDTVVAYGLSAPSATPPYPAFAQCQQPGGVLSPCATGVVVPTQTTDLTLTLTDVTKTAYYVTGTMRSST